MKAGDKLDFCPYVLIKSSIATDYMLAQLEEYEIKVEIINQ